MTVTIGRRKLLAALGGAAASWPLAARAQQGGKRYTIGILRALASKPRWIQLFSMACGSWDGSKGKNVVFESRNAENRLERLPELAADLVRLKVDVIAASGTLAPLAVKQATKTIPIVMTAAGDPLGSGLVASLARPGGNVTGMSLMVPDLGAKLECGQSLFRARIQRDAGWGADIGDRSSSLGVADDVHQSDDAGGSRGEPDHQWGASCPHA